MARPPLTELEDGGPWPRGTSDPGGAGPLDLVVIIAHTQLRLAGTSPMISGGPVRRAAHPGPGPPRISASPREHPSPGQHAETRSSPARVAHPASHHPVGKHSKPDTTTVDREPARLNVSSGSVSSGVLTVPVLVGRVPGSGRLCGIGNPLFGFAQDLLRRVVPVGGVAPPTLLLGFRYLGCHTSGYPSRRIGNRGPWPQAPTPPACHAHHPARRATPHRDPDDDVRRDPRPRGRAADRASQQPRLRLGRVRGDPRSRPTASSCGSWSTPRPTPTRSTGTSPSSRCWTGRSSTRPATSPRCTVPVRSSPAPGPTRRHRRPRSCAATRSRPHRTRRAGRTASSHCPGRSRGSSCRSVRAGGRRAAGDRRDVHRTVRLARPDRWQVPDRSASSATLPRLTTRAERLHRRCRLRRCGRPDSARRLGAAPRRRDPS
jgi:hypothetical protein